MMYYDITATHYITVDIDGHVINTVLAGDVSLIDSTLGVNVYGVRLMYSAKMGAIDPTSELYETVLNKIREFFDALDNSVVNDIQG